jgi:crotonobetainyl-CoA:carnitine CoA-transferase CaiB-like acyl-CoA transferase
VLLADIGAEVLKVERTGSAGSLETLQERQRVSLNYVDREVRIAV